MTCRQIRPHTHTRKKNNFASCSKCKKMQIKSRRNFRYALIFYLCCQQREREREDNGLFITLVPKVLQSFFIRWLDNFGDFYWILIGLLIKLSDQTFQPLILIYRIGNFVYQHWGYTSIYRLLSYPFRSLDFFIYVASQLQCVSASAWEKRMK